MDATHRYASQEWLRLFSKTEADDTVILRRREVGVDETIGCVIGRKSNTEKTSFT